jgi:nucleotide-binding universal stress UspA family protein
MIEGPILTATDLGDATLAALLQADAVATSIHTPLIVCHALPELIRARMLFPHWAEVDRDAQEVLNAKGREATEWQVERLTGRSPDQFVAAVDSGSPHAVILTQAEEARAGLIVLGPGPTADRVVRYAPCPVLVARPGPRGPVLGATDFSDPALPAIRAAAGEATRRGVSLRLLHAIDIAMPVSPLAPELAAGFAPIAVDELQQAAMERLEQALASTGVEGTCAAVGGPAAASILRYAKEIGAELIVVGTRGRSGLARLALGSTAEAVLHGASCSVLVVRLRPD